MATYRAVSRGLAHAFIQRHKKAAFSFVQSSSSYATGLLLPRTPGVPRVVRLNSFRPWWQEADGEAGRVGARLKCQLERSSAARADIVYAPSHAVASACRTNWGIPAQVLRPPFFQEVEPAIAPPPSLPSRYLLHFGQIGPRKGSDLIADALPLAWASEPSLQMVWVGQARATFLETCRAKWAGNAHQVLVCPPMDKPSIYSVIRASLATVLPSKVDNLPNTAIESLLLGIPVLATRAGSLDEIVEHGRNGLLVEPGNPAQLAEAMVSLWRDTAPVRRNNIHPPAILPEMQPDRAARNLLKLVGLAPLE